MNRSECAIVVERLSKVYKLYDSPLHRLKEAVDPFRRKYHRDFHALHDVSFEIGKGETIGVIGKNGSGKSTLLKIIAGVLSPSSGHVAINGRVSALLELGGGFNPQLTGIENIYFSGAIMGYTKAEMQRKIENILSFAGIGDFLYQPVKTYSSGMYVRLAFSVAIHVNPDVLIIDEALAVGDMNFQAKCMSAFHRFQEMGVTILFASHDIGSIKSLCSRVIYLDHGRIKYGGIASEVAEQYVRDIREEMNAEQRKYLNGSNLRAEAVEGAKEGLPQPHVVNLLGIHAFKESEDFDQRVSCFRYGSGEAKVTLVELLDVNNDAIAIADFDQHVKIRIFFLVRQNAQISVNYVIYDDKKINILSSGLRQCGEKLLDVKQGERYMVEYRVRLPLKEGDYSIEAQITSPVVIDETARFLDVVDNAALFKMQRHNHARIWSKVYLPHQLSISKYA